MTGEVGHVVFSHGFATGKESKGLFTATGDMLVEDGVKIHKFDYNGVNDDGDFLTRTFDEQADKLDRVIGKIPEGEPLVVVAHSAGVIPASRAQNISRACHLIAAVPRWQKDEHGFASDLRNRGGREQEDGSWVIGTRKAGSLVIPKQYVEDIDNADFIADYQKVSNLPNTGMTLIRALNDEMHPVIDKDYFGEHVQIVDVMHADHNFTGKDRNIFATIVSQIVLRRLREFEL